MKKAILAKSSFALLAILSLSSCIQMMKDASDVDIVEPITVSYKVSAVTGFIPKGGQIEADPSFHTAGLDVTLTNIKTSAVYSAKTDADGVATMDGVDPGVYSVGVTGTAVNDGSKYCLNGTIPSISLFSSVTKADAMSDSKYQMNVRPAKVGSLVFSEIYYCGIADFYFRDQTYQIYNNGDEVVYLDGVCFAQLHPNIASANLPVWPDEDGVDNYVYGLMVWQFPGSGREYPLQPGEAVIVAQESRDHTVNNPNSYDNSMAEWECWTGNVSRDNADVPNLPYIFYTSLNKMQWLTSVFGAAFALYKPDGDIVNAEYYSNDGPNVQHEVKKSSKYAKIPADCILDGVELLPNMDALNMKRIPGFVDAGGTSVGSTYIGKPVTRKVESRRSDGTPIFQDTNNSTVDFVINDHPVIRRDGQKVPSWSRANK